MSASQVAESIGGVEDRVQLLARFQAVAAGRVVCGLFGRRQSSEFQAIVCLSYRRSLLLVGRQVTGIPWTVQLTPRGLQSTHQLSPDMNNFAGGCTWLRQRTVPVSWRI